MNTKTITATLSLALAMLSQQAPAAPAPAPAPAAQLIADYSSAYNALGMAQLELSYVRNIQAIVRETDLPRQRQLFSSFAQRLKTLDTRGANACQRFDLQQIAFEVATNLQKLDVLEKFLALGSNPQVPDTGLYGMPVGKAWYDYFVLRWLNLDTTPQQLKVMGEQELARVLARYRALQAKMGYAGRDAAFAEYLGGPAFRYPDGETPQADYEARQAIVYSNLDKLFLPVKVEPAQIRQSTLGAAMQADAYYVTGEQIFYYNKARPSFERRSLDWLLLHESTPGHHYQTSYARVRQACPQVLPSVFYSAFAEGWGAYVEEFGSPLGLYRQDADELGAVEWDLVRSIRVVLDVGINSEGWTQQQALAYWHQQLPMLPDLAEREIARVRNWPVQAITYKQGAVLIRQLRAQVQARQGAAFDIRRFHDDVLTHGSVALALLPSLVLDRQAPASQ